MKLKLPYKNKIPVAAHRGNSKYYPENTLIAMRSALELNADMIETDVHMTKDGELVLMHDHTVDRTTDGTGLIKEKTLAEIKALDAGIKKGEQFKGEKVPTLRELLELCKDRKDLLYNIEFKDFPIDSGDFAYRAADKIVDMLKEYGILKRCVLNSWCGELLEYLDEKYGDSIMIHGYSAHFLGPNQKKLVYNYAYCVCLFGVDEKPVVPKQYFDFCREYGVEPWAYYGPEDPKLYDEAIENGAMLFTANDPKWVMDYLRAKGLHS